jgi:uncharacterized SAM-binding protein YcdF (DUF218 family)
MRDWPASRPTSDYRPFHRRSPKQARAAHGRNGGVRIVVRGCRHHRRTAGLRWAADRSVRRADAIFVLGGNGYQRYPYALELALQGLAPRVVMSNPAGDRDIWLTDLCGQHRYKFTVSCFEPEPATTVGEARELRRLAREQGWRTVIVVTFRPHISRARYILQQCFDGRLIMTEWTPELSLEYWMWTYLYQTGGYVRAALQPAC